MRITDSISVTRADLIQFGEYFVGGATYFWVGYAVFALGYSGFGWDWLPAKILADVVGWTANYVIQRYWAFNNPLLKKQEGVTIGKYSLLTAFNLVLDYLIIAGLKHLGVSPYVGFFISAAFFTVWNYAWYRFWVFYAKSRGAKEAII